MSDIEHSVMKRSFQCMLDFLRLYGDSINVRATRIADVQAGLINMSRCF